MPTTPLLLLLWATLTPADLGDWHKVTSKAGGFAVTMPGKAEPKTIAETTDAGPAEVRLLVAEVDGITFLASGAANSAQVSVAKDSPYFDGIRESAATGPGKTLQKEQRGTFQKMPMCYFRYATTAPNGRQFVVQARYLIADPTHIYTLQVIVPKGNNVDADVKRFFDSFDRIGPGDPLPSPKTQAKAQPKEKATGGSVGPAIKPQWRPFRPAAQGFAATMPGEPKHERQADDASSVQFDTYSVDLGNCAYSAIAYEFPERITQQDPGTTLDNLAKGLATGMKGTVADLKPVRDDGLDGREVVIDFAGPDQKPAVGHGRLYLDGPRAYVLMFNGPQAAGNTPEVRTFLESFRRANPPSPARRTTNPRP